jgi:Tfp pilus assembly protein PilF
MNRTLCACAAALVFAAAGAGCVKRVGMTPEEAESQVALECAIQFHRFHTMQKHADYLARAGMERQASVTYEQALGALDEIRKMDPFWNAASVREHRESCRVEMGQLFGRLKIRDLREGKAIERFIARYAADPQSPAPYAELGDFYFNEHEYDNAMAQYREALLRDISNIPVLISMAQILSRTGEPEWARQIYVGILEVNHDLAVVHYNLGGIYFMMQKPTNAYREYTRALELDRNSPHTCNALGVVCKQLKRYDQAENHLKNAIRIDPSYAPAYYNLGLVFMEKNNYPNATTYLQRAIDLFGPESPRGREIAELIRNRRRSP